MGGIGRIFKRSKTWYVAWFHRNREYRKSTHSQSETIARRMLKEELRQESARGELAGLGEERVSFRDLAEGLLRDYRVNEYRGADKVAGKIKNLERFFGGMRAVEITPGQVKRYIESTATSQR